jgi:hypothetical protein
MKNRYLSLVRFVVTAAALWHLWGQEVGAQTTIASSGSSLVSIQLVGNAKSDQDDKHRFGLGDRITVQIEGTASAIQRATADSKKLVLLMDEVALRGLCTNAVAGGDAMLITNTTFITNRVAVTNGAPPNQTVITKETITTKPRRE